MTGLALPHGELVRQLLDLGVEPGGVLIVHTAFSKVMPIEGGPVGLIDALRTALGPAGTLLMPSMSDDDDIPFDPRTAACRSLGVVADSFWRLPGVLRSDNPHGFAACGPAAPALTHAHSLDVPHGPDSPPGRVFELGGQILLLGVGHDANTSVHLAEAMAGVRYRIPKHLTLLVNGRVIRHEYAETDHCCENFQKLDGWLESAGQQRRGKVGHAEARLMRARDVIATAVLRLHADETVFLHAPGVDAECDAARASIPQG
jgi:aminoglycoside 3-N-acetyltransferase